MKKIMMLLLMVSFVLGMTGCLNGASEGNLATIFANSVFIGDSITEGFVFNEILPSEHVIAGAGTTAGFVYDDVDVLADQKPEHVFLMFGSIDLLMPVDNPQELFRSDLAKLVNRIKEILPDSIIYLQSILPVTQEAITKEPRYQGIDEYNKILVELADELSVTYVDLQSLVEENPDVFAEDGVHFKKEFFQLWLKELSQLLPQGR